MAYTLARRRQENNMRCRMLCSRACFMAGASGFSSMRLKMT